MTNSSFDYEPVANCVSQRDPIQFLNRDSLLDEEKKEGRKGWVKIIRKKKKEKERRKRCGVQFGACNSTSAAIARDRASEIAGAVIKVLGRRANSFPVTNYGVLRSRAEILRVIGRRGRRRRGSCYTRNRRATRGTGRGEEILFLEDSSAEWD